MKVLMLGLKPLWCAPILLAALMVSGCAQTPVAPQAPQMKVFAAEMKNVSSDAPYVVMVSIDGYRWDYNSKFSPKNLSEIAQTGVAAESLIPIYPSKTFPNHYALATGLYAQNHGIVGNTFYDPYRQGTYTLPDRKAVEEGSWYDGNPLWIAIQKQGLLTASYFWVGSEADVQGKHPNYFYQYNQTTPNLQRVEQVLNWLKLPKEERPHYITLYFSEVDSAGHYFGTSSDELRQAVHNVDHAIGVLRQGLKELDIPVNLIVVSDHGMQDMDPTKVITIDENPAHAKALESFIAVEQGPQMMLHLKPGASPKLIAQAKRVLSRNAKNYRVLDQEQLKAKNLHTPRAGDLLIEADAPYLLRLKDRTINTKGGNHGWDPYRAKDMQGIFYAEGPAFAKGVRLPSFELIHVYPLVMKVLGLDVQSRIDGKLEPTKKALAQP